MVCTHTKNSGEIARGVAPKEAKTCFLVNNTTQTFVHLSCADFDHFWNRRCESVSACVHRWKNSEFLHREFYSSPKL